MFHTIKVMVTALAFALPFGGAHAASLNLTTGDPTVVAGQATVDFAFGELIVLDQFVTSTSGDDVASADTVFASSDAVTGGFSISDSSLTELAGGDLIASGFTDNTIEFLFGVLSGTAASAYDSGQALVEVDFGSVFSGRTSIFDQLVDGDFYSATVTVSAVTAIAPIPLPAGIVLMLSGLVGLGVASRRRKIA